MSRLSKDALLGASDLVEREVELDSIGGSVVVRTLPAEFSNAVFEDATELTVDGSGEQTMRVNPGKYQILQVLHGLVDPKLDSVDEVKVFAHNCGPAWQKIIETIDEISAINKDAVEQTNTSFRAGGPETEPAAPEVDADDAGNGRPDLPVRVGVGVGDVGE